MHSTNSGLNLFFVSFTPAINNQDALTFSFILFSCSQIWDFVVKNQGTFDYLNDGVRTITKYFIKVLSFAFSNSWSESI